MLKPEYSSQSRSMSAPSLSKHWQGSLKQAITASTVGNILEWYDFALYGYVAPYIGPLFFPSHDPVASTIAAFAVFAIGYLARPIGAVVLGWTGDRFGRKTMLVISITILGFSSCAIGIMPTYQSIGNFAPVLLVLMRLAQGFSVGGEYTGSVAYATEVSPHGHRGLLSSLATTGTMMGILLASMSVWVVSSICGQQAFSQWAWRIPFLMGLMVMIFGIAIRTKIPETMFRDESFTEPKTNAFTVLKTYWRKLVHAIGIVTGANVVLYLLFVFVLHLATEAGASHVEQMNTIGLAVTIPGTVLGGWLSDNFGRKRISIITYLIMVILAIPAFCLCVTFRPWPGGPYMGPTLAFLLGQLAMAAPMGIVFGLQGVMISEMLPKEVRCTVFSVSYSLAMGLFAGTAPMVAEWMLKSQAWQLGPAFYMVIWLTIGLWSIKLCDETAFNPLD
ncbi:MAG: MFS transporter [Pseudomonadota bacterium]